MFEAQRFLCWKLTDIHVGNSKIFMLEAQNFYAGSLKNFMLEARRYSCWLFGYLLDRLKARVGSSKIFMLEAQKHS